MTGMGASAPPGLPEEFNVLEGALCNSITNWKYQLRSVKRTMSKAGAGEILTEKISQLHQSGKEFRAAFNQYTDKWFERDLEGGVAPTRL